MARDNLPEAMPTWKAGIRGMAIGGLIGALVFGLISSVMDLLRVGGGGPGLGVMAGIVVGAAAGTFISVIKASRRELHAL